MSPKRGVNKRPASATAKGSEPKGKKSKSSCINYLDVNTDFGRPAWNKYSKLVEPGMAIVTPAIDSRGFVMGEVVLQVLDTAVHQSGLFVQAVVAAWENAAAKKEMNILQEKDCLAHLCKTTGSCKGGVDTQKVVHIREWKVVKPEALDEKYITPDQRRFLMKKVKEPSGKSITEADEDEEDDKDDDDDEGEEEATPMKATGKGKGGTKRARDADEDEDDDEAYETPKKKSKNLMDRLYDKMQSSAAEEKSPKASLKKATADELRVALAKKKEEHQQKKKKAPMRKAGKTEGNLLSRMKSQKKAPDEEEDDDGEDEEEDGDDHRRRRDKKRPRKDNEDGDDDDENSDGRSKRRRRGRRHDRTRRRRRRYDSSDSSHSRSESGDADSLFGLAERGGNGLSNRLVHLAKHRPGTLLRSTLGLMHQQLKPGDAPLGKTATPPIVHKFLQQVTLAQHNVKGRDLRELATLAQACDQILKGHLEQGLELLLQRYKRVEAQATQMLPGAVAENLEIAAVNRTSSLSLAEREMATDLTKQWMRYHDKVPSQRPE
jgi:hypothetical protein